MSPATEPEVLAGDLKVEQEAIRRELKKHGARLDQIEIILSNPDVQNVLQSQLKLDGKGELVIAKDGSQRAQVQELAGAVGRMERAISMYIQAKAVKKARRVPTTSDGVYKSFRAVRDHAGDQAAADASYKLFCKIRNGR